MTGPLVEALGHVRNAVWQLMSADDPDALALGLDCLDLEALLSLDEQEPDLVPLEPDAASSLAAAARTLDPVRDQIAPAAWATLHALQVKLG